jgi:hypothetical protein
MQSSVCYHFRLDQRLESIDFAIRLLLDKPDLAESTLSNDSDGGVILWSLLCPQESKVLHLCPSFLVNLLLPAWLRQCWILHDLFRLECSANHISDGSFMMAFASYLALRSLAR